MALSDPYGILSENQIDKESLSNILNDFEVLVLNAKNKEKDKNNPEYFSDRMHCGVPMERSANNLFDECVFCGAIINEITQDVFTVDEYRVPELRIVGKGSSKLQSNLFKSASACDTRAQKKRAIEKEFIILGKKYEAIHKRSIPKNIINMATDIYSGIQSKCVKRSRKKRAIMGGCLQHSALCNEYSPTSSEISNFMGLDSKCGISSGAGFVRKLAFENVLDIDPNPPIIVPEIQTTFRNFGYSNDQEQVLRPIIENFIEVLYELSIGMKPHTKTRIIGSTYNIIKRTNNIKLFPVKPENIAEFCSPRPDIIKTNTVLSFLEMLYEEHDSLVPFYEHHNLISTRSILGINSLPS